MLSALPAGFCQLLEVYRLDAPFEWTFIHQVVISRHC
jgi:hypothetical protein